MNNFFLNLSRIIQSYTLGQRIVISTVLVGMVSALISLVVWASKPEYVALYTNVEPSMGSKMVNDLNSASIDYKLENGGKTILVPNSVADEWRMRFAESGYIGDVIAGYEIFDNNDMGMTDSRQKLNMKRALEGELMRTINQFPNVQNSRVHLTIPQSRLFQKDDGGKASVVLYLSPGTYLDREQIKGISALVANSVEGIDPRSVVIVDTKGNMLSESITEDGSTSNSQQDMQIAAEARIQAKIQDLLDNAVGYNNSKVQVSVKMDFSIDEESRESYDRVGDPISEEIITEETLNDTGAILNTKSNTVANYEMNKTITRKVKPVGIIDSVSVAALINVKYEIDRDGNGEPVPSEIKGKFKTISSPRNEGEIEKIRELIQAAAGGSMATVVVNEIQFDNVNEQIADLEIAEMVNEQSGLFSPKNVNNYVIPTVFMIFGFVLMYLLLKSLNNTEGNGIDGILPQAPGQLAGSGDSEPAAQFVENATEALEGINPQTNDQAPAQIPGNPTVAAVNYSKTSPEEAAKIIRAWVNQS
jgi:flagellar M-ring protein FliF